MLDVVASVTFVGIWEIPAFNSSIQDTVELEQSFGATWKRTRVDATRDLSGECC